MPAAMFGVRTSGHWFHIALGLGVLGLFCVIRFYGNMDDFILRSMQRTEDSNSAPLPATAKPAGKGTLSGWQCLFWQHAKLIFSFAVMYLVLMGFLNVFVFKGGKVEMNVYLPMMAIMGVAFSLPWYHAARIFRMLPVEAFRLTCIFELLHIVPTLAMLGLTSGLFWIWGTLDWDFLWRALVVAVALQSLIPALFLRWGSKQLVQFFIFFVLIVGMGAGVTILSNLGVSLMVVTLCALAIAITGFAWTRYELARGNKAYQARPPLPGMAMAGNR
jgi:hypothetical protein